VGEGEGEHWRWIVSERRKYLHSDGGRLPGATTILGVLDKPALIGWAALLAAEVAVDAYRGGADRAHAIAAGKRAPNQRRDTAADAGTLAHDLVERTLTGQPWAVEVDADTEAPIACARRVVAALEPYEVVASELAMTCDDVAGVRGFGGTADFFLREKATGRLLIGDLKTGKRAYPDSVIPQLAAYAYLWRLAGHPPVDGGIVVSAPVDGADVQIYEVSTEALAAGWAVFSACLMIYASRGALRFGDAR
jgi:hypothetical protein